MGAPQTASMIPSAQSAVCGHPAKLVSFPIHEGLPVVTYRPPLNSMSSLGLCSSPVAPVTPSLKESGRSGQTAPIGRGALACIVGETVTIWLPMKTYAA